MGGAKVGLHVAAACPAGYEPNEEIVNTAKEIAKKTGAVIEVMENPQAAVQGADFLYTDVWTSMGQEEEAAKRLQDFAAYQVNEQLVQWAKPDYKFFCIAYRRTAVKK
ncbi:hypothetical protein GCM10020331_041970 [Ectobacillus funiculus]